MDDIRKIIRGGPQRMVPRTANPGPFEEAPSSSSAPITKGPGPTLKRAKDYATANTSDKAEDDKAEKDTYKQQADQYAGPSVLDVLVTKALLHKGCNLPIELVEVIIDHAEYWPHTTVSVDVRDTDGHEALPVYGTHNNQNQFLVRTLPLGFPTRRHSNISSHHRTELQPHALSTEHSLEHLQSLVGSPDSTIEHPCRKIVFTIVSHDQGWGGDYDCHGTFKHSYTWFDVGLERFDAQHGSGKEKADVKLPYESLRSVIPGTEEMTPIEQANAQLDQPVLDAHNPHSVVELPYNPYPNNQMPATAGESSTSAPVPNEESPGLKRRFAHEMCPNDKMIQCNVLAVQDDRTYRVEWRDTDCVKPESAEGDALEAEGRGRETGTGEFVRSLKLGDVVTVWAKARFPGWVNYIRSVKVEVYWGV